jgi:hypothetical protein
MVRYHPGGSPEDAMTHLIACCLALVASFQYPPGTGTGTPGEAPDDSVEVRRLVDAFEKLSKDPEKDKEATGLLDTMVAKFKDAAPRDRGRITKVVVACVRMFDTPKDKTKPRNLPVAACEHLGQMGVEAEKPMIELLLDRKVGLEMPRVMPLAAGLVRLGIGTEDALVNALKMLDDPNPRLYVAITTALSSMELETQAKRKRVAGNLLTSHETFASRVEKDKSVIVEAKPRLVSEGESATINTLNALAVQKQPDVTAFKTWFAENKAKDWPEK